MSIQIKSTQLESPNYAYIELSKQTLQKQLTVLFPACGLICTMIAFSYFVSDVEPFFTLTAVTGSFLCYLLNKINNKHVNPFILVWLLIFFTTTTCALGFMISGANDISHTIGLTIPLLCFFSLSHKSAWWYSSLFGVLYMVLSVNEISEKHIQISEALQNISAYAMVLILAYLLARHRNEAIDLVRKTASTDFLTGLHNRQGLIPIYQNEAARSRRYLRDFSMALIDIDNLKEINDRYGLKAGDKVLMMLAKCLKDNCRKADHVARIGGEEYCLLLPETDIKQAEELATRLREALETWSLELDNGEIIQVTISIGLTQIEYQDFSYDYIKADSALMRAKSWGKNQIAVSE
ncbi:diguanylate cyclase [Photobacterium jeanii]|uniref:diguanylate cyclase n=1 Tax=Photobacterium jeanii TaxID=858640 RepID=A0A178K3H4_9GAMM|nr:GGDEF domain-containing protein [Photobacterium jeanii]OAN11656.1 diguanylate cyclase [Photobacterium jeanii]PST91179.1 GGDEF domain-containing protein [Photobacterium jeanii]